MSGQPIFFIQQPSAVKNVPAWCFIQVTAGSAAARATTYHHFTIGTAFADDNVAGANAFIVVPNGTSVTVNIGGADGDDTIYVYKQ